MTLDAEKAGVPVVRGLVWRDLRPHSFPDMWSATSQCGVYDIEEQSASDSPVYVALGPHYAPIADKDSLDEAKDACQADYEARILSAINPDYASELDTARAEIERLRAMLTATEKHGSVYAAVERVLDERSAWVTRPNHETTMRVALAATIAANELLGDPVGKVADAQCAVTNAEMARDDEQERADRAESSLTAAQARIAELEGALREIAAPIEGVAVGDPWAFYADMQEHARATLSPAVKEPK